MKLIILASHGFFFAGLAAGWWLKRLHTRRAIDRLMNVVGHEVVSRYKTVEDVRHFLGDWSNNI